MAKGRACRHALDLGVNPGLFECALSVDVAKDKLFLGVKAQRRRMSDQCAQMADTIALR